METPDPTLRLLHTTLLGSLHAALGCDVAFCYTEWSSADRVASGAMLIRNTVEPLPARPLHALLADAAPARSVWAQSPSCVAYVPPCAILDGLPDPYALSHAFDAYLLREGRCVGVFGAVFDPRDPKLAGYPSKLLQVGAALATLVGLHNECRGLHSQGFSLEEPRSTTRTAATTTSHDDTTPSCALSKREQEIACLLVSGYAAVNVAAILSISEHTVRTYIRRLYRKLGVNNRAELVRQCLGMALDTLVQNT
jgi:DNA-binding CsgD family transcriptional regulator